MSFALSHRETVAYAVKYAKSIEYLDVALGCYERFETNDKWPDTIKYFKLNYGLPYPIKCGYKLFTKRIVELVYEMYDEISTRFFTLFEDQVYRAMFEEEDLLEIFIERYMTACRKTKILEVDRESAVLRQRVLFNMICVLTKKKLYIPSSSILINFLQTFCTEYILGSRIYAEEEYMKHLDHILEQCKIMKYKLWGAWPSYKLEGEPYNPVSIYLFMDNLSYIELMYKYGIDYAFSMQVYKVTSAIFCHIKNRGTQISIDNAFYQLVHHNNPKRMHLILLNFCTFIFNTGKNNSNNMMCLETTWRGISDALVTANEMENALKPLIKKEFQWLLEKTVNIYRDSGIFDNRQAQHMPRNLSHQCRCAIRRLLNKNFNLPEGVNGLDIPENLKDFLSLKH